jgi:hypothetical protein
MSWLTRGATALALVLAVGAAPVVLDYCATSCAAQQALTRNGGQPACHHAATSSPRIGEKHTPVGHDHHGMTATAASNSVTPERTAASALAVLSIPPALDLRLTHRIDRSGSPPGLLATPHDRSLPLRI